MADERKSAEALEAERKKLAELMELRRNANEADKKALDEKIERTQFFINLLDKSLKYDEKKIENLNKEIASYNKLLDQTKNYENAQMDAFQKAEIARSKDLAEIELRNEKIKMYRQLLADGKITEEQLVQYKNLIKLNEEHQKRNVYLKESVELGQSLGTIFDSFGKHPIFNVQKMAKLGAQLISASKDMKEFASTAATSLTTGFINATINLVFELNKAEAQFIQTTRASNEFVGEMRNVYDVVRENAVQMDQFYKTTSVLYGSFVDFNQISKSVRDEIAATTSTMVQAGHSADTLAKDLQLLTVSFGILPKQANQTLMELDAFAQDIGVPPSQLTEQFAAMGSGLAKLGADGVQAFKDLARVSKITGFEMNKILKMTDRFDTFEGAAEQAGRLNAAIGGNFVNAMELMTSTDPVERFEMIRNSLLEAGLEFDNMSYYQRKFFAESLGLADASELAAVMRGDIESLDAEIGKTSADYARMADEARRSANFQERFQAVMQKFIPIFDTLLEAIDLFLLTTEESTRRSGEFSSEAKALQGTMGSLASAFNIFAKVMKVVIDFWPLFLGGWLIWKGYLIAVNLGLTKLAVTAPAAAGSMTGLSSAIIAVGGAFVTSAAGWGIFAGVMLSVSAAMYGIAEVIKYISTLFTSIDSKQFSALTDFVKDFARMPDEFTGTIDRLTQLGFAIESVGLALESVSTVKMDAIKEISAIADSIQEMPLSSRIDLVDAIKTAAAMNVTLAGAVAGTNNQVEKGSTGNIVLNATVPVYIGDEKIQEKIEKGISVKMTKVAYQQIQGNGAGVLDY